MKANKTYTWNSRKLKKKQHLVEKTGKTYCRVENGGGKLDVVSENAHPTKPVCKLCLQFFKKPRENKKKRKKCRPSFYLSWEWKKARFNTLKKYGAVCMLCGSDHRVVVDHIKPRSKYPELELDEDNLQVLCNECNMGKSNDDQTDFRPAEPSLSVLMGERME